jgi:uncharacterized membrane protein YgaE (UPF0421/DUF939 family)
VREFTVSLQSVLNGFRFALRIAIAATLSFYLATLVKLEHPMYAVVASVLATDLSIYETRRQAVPGLLAAALGAFVGLVARSLLEPRLWLVGLAIAAAILLSQVTSLRGVAKLAGLVCATLMTATDWHWWQAFFRLSEVALGIAGTWLPAYLLAATGTWFAYAAPKRNVIPFRAPFTSRLHRFDKERHTAGGG